MLTSHPRWPQEGQEAAGQGALLVAQANGPALSVPSDPLPGPGPAPGVTFLKQASLWVSGHTQAWPVCSDGRGPELETLDKGKRCSCWWGVGVGF